MAKLKEYKVNAKIIQTAKATIWASNQQEAEEFADSLWSDEFIVYSDKVEVEEVEAV